MAAHTFTESGTFTVTRPGTVEVLVVGGGGGGSGAAGGKVLPGSMQHSREVNP